MSFTGLSEDILGTIIKFINEKDIPNIAKTNKKLYKATLLNYKFDDYKTISKLDDKDFNLILKNVNVNKEVIFKAIIISNRYETLKTYINNIDPGINKNGAIIEASRNGYLEIVKLLLKDKRVDPGDFNNEAIKSASENGHHEIVKLLLQDKRVDPGNFYNYAIIRASYNGYHKVVKLLLSDSRVDPSAANNSAIKWSFIYDYIKVVKLLAKSSKISLSNFPDLKILTKIINSYQ